MLSLLRREPIADRLLEPCSRHRVRRSLTTGLLQRAQGRLFEEGRPRMQGTKLLLKSRLHNPGGAIRKSSPVRPSNNSRLCLNNSSRLDT